MLTMQSIVFISDVVTSINTEGQSDVFLPSVNFVTHLFTMSIPSKPIEIVLNSVLNSRFKN